MYDLKELVAVHLTDQEVTDGFLRPHSYVPHVYKGRELLCPREMLDFTINSVVPDHGGGTSKIPVYSWKDKHYAYIIPLLDLLPYVINVMIQDTVVLGKIALSEDSVIIKAQTADKVIDTIWSKGYPVFDIKGITSLDDIYHNDEPIVKAEFYSLFDGFDVDTVYRGDSHYNILKLDSYFRHLTEDNPFPLSALEWESDIKSSFGVLQDRYSGKKEIAEPMERLRLLVGIYANYLQSIKDWSDTDYSSHDESLAARRKIGNMLAWEKHSALFGVSKGV